MSSPPRSPMPRAGWGAGIDTTAEAADRATGHTRAGAARFVDRADEPADNTGWRRRWTWPAILAVVVAAGMVMGGVDVWRSVLIALGASVALWSAIATAMTPRISWHEDVPGERYRSSSSWEVPGLAGARESDAAFEHYLRPRLWALAQDLLRARDIDPGSDEAKALVGKRQYDVLTGVDTDRTRTTPSVSALCQTIAHLAVDPQPGGRPPVNTPSLKGLAGTPRRRIAQSKFASGSLRGPRPRRGAVSSTEASTLGTKGHLA